MVCQQDSDCWPEMSECADDGIMIQGVKRCQCMIGYQAYLGRFDQSGTEIDEYLCGKQIKL